MADGKSGESNDQPLNEREVKVDLLQRRLHNKTQRVVNTIQFNTVALSVVAGVVQFAKPADVKLNLMIISGGALMLFSIFLSLVGISLNGAPLPWLREDPSRKSETGSIISEYQLRNKYLGWIMPATLGLGGLGAAVILIGGLRIIGIEPVFPWWISIPGIFGFFVGACALGYNLGS